MTKHPADPLRARMLELVQEIEEHLGKFREFGSIPGNAWLARGELHQLSGLLSDLESVLEEIKQDDAENGY